VPASRGYGGELFGPGRRYICMEEQEQAQTPRRVNVGKNRATQAQEIASAIANLRKVAEAIRQRAESERQAKADKNGES
jgi:hypothetical protein